MIKLEREGSGWNDYFSIFNNHFTNVFLNLRSLGSLLLFIGAIVLGISNLSFLFNCSASTIVMVLLLGSSLLFLLMYGCISEERENNENKNSQSGLA